MRFACDIHSWLRHLWKSLANRLTRDPKFDMIRQDQECLMRRAPICQTDHQRYSDKIYDKQHLSYVTYVWDFCWLSFCGPAGWSVIQYPVGWLDEILLWAGDLLNTSAVLWWANSKPEPERLL